jgi:flagellum-specific ATP synthase
MPDVVRDGHGESAQTLRALLAAHRDVAPLLALGAHRSGALPETDRAIALWPKVETFLRQGRDDESTFTASVSRLKSLTGSEG